MQLADPTTFDQIYRDHARSVYAAALRITKDPTVADDVTHDVFMRLWRRPARFDPARGEIGPFLRLMARSRALDLWREGQVARRAQERLEGGAEAELSHATPDDPAARALADERATTVRDALELLPHAQREAVVLAYWGGLTAEEISRRVDAPLGTVKSRLRLGLAKLRTTVSDLAREPTTA